MNHRATCLAACDDAGDVRVLDLKTDKWMRKFDRTHDNVCLIVYSYMHCSDDIVITCFLLGSFIFVHSYVHDSWNIVFVNHMAFKSYFILLCVVCSRLR